MMISVIVLAVLPALILLYFVYQQDKMQPEPLRWVGKGFLYGALAVLVSLFISVPLLFTGLYPAEIASYSDAFRQAFFGAALPEETAKLLCLWLLLRRNPHFDERMDGIVYAVAVGMGFAAFENIEYLFAAGSSWVTTGIGRSLTAIPGHFGFAVIMGYYFSLCYFDRYRASGASWKMWLYPVLAHGFYDTVAMSAEVSPEMDGAITVVILLFCFWMFKWARQRMRLHLMADASDAAISGGVDNQ